MTTEAKVFTLDIHPTGDDFQLTPEMWAGLNTRIGDIITIDESYRGSFTYVVTESGPKNCVDSCGWFYIPADVSRQFTDPIQYYRSARYYDDCILPDIQIHQSQFDWMETKYGLNRQKITSDSVLYTYELDFDTGEHFRYELDDSD